MKNHRMTGWLWVFVWASLMQAGCATNGPHPRTKSEPAVSVPTPVAVAQTADKSELRELIVWIEKP